MTTRERNEWTLDLLDIAPNDRILEIGFGPGVGIEQACKRISGGKIVGIDPSEVMKEQAEKRNRKAVRKGKVELLTGEVEELPDFDELFDKMFSVNSVMFWRDRARVFRLLHERLKSEGAMAITYQPIGKDAPDAETLTEQIAGELKQAGFLSVRKESRMFNPAPAVCLIARKERTRT